MYWNQQDALRSTARAALPCPSLVPFTGGVFFAMGPHGQLTRDRRCYRLFGTGGILRAAGYPKELGSSVKYMPVHWIPGAGIAANAYVYKSVLIDAGILPMEVAPYKEGIATILLTHCHYDHTAWLSEIQQMCHARVCIHPLDAPGLTDDLRSVAIFFGARPPPAVSDCRIGEGDMIEGLRVLHTPGHSPGSICLFDAEEGILFSGDTVFTHGSFGRYDLPGGERHALLKSLERLSTLDVRAIYPGHGEPVEKQAERHIAAALSVARGIHG